VNLTDLRVKRRAGYDVTFTDAWARVLSYVLVNPTQAQTLSGITQSSNFTDYDVPYPIFAALGVDESVCLPGPNAIQYEFHPYEFGSWDSGVNAFTQTAYLGSRLSNGSGSCETNFDSIGFILGRLLLFS
jgi:lysophospholipase